MEPTQIEPTEKAPSLARLFLSFLRLGATAFGGPAMIAVFHILWHWRYFQKIFKFADYL